MCYRRADVTGGTYFFTVNLAERKGTLLVDHVEVLRNALRDVKARYPFHLDAMVILPDHLHALWTLPVGDVDYPTRWMLIKMNFSRRIPPGERCNQSRMGKGERGLWQRRYWKHLIRNEQDYQRHRDYIHYNPIKHGYVERVRDWPYSSFHRDVNRGIYSSDWAGVPEADMNAGEAD